MMTAQEFADWVTIMEGYLETNWSRKSTKDLFEDVKDCPDSVLGETKRDILKWPGNYKPSFFNVAQVLNRNAGAWKARGKLKVVDEIRPEKPLEINKDDPELKRLFPRLCGDGEGKE